jgi:hypothetical protein
VGKRIGFEEKSIPDKAGYQVYISIGLDRGQGMIG